MPNDYNIDVIEEGLARAKRAKANGDRAGPGGCWWAARKKVYTRHLEQYDERIMAEPFRAPSLVDEELKIMAEQEQAEENGSEPEKNAITFAANPPPVTESPPVEADEQDTVNVTIEEDIPPDEAPDPPSNLLMSLERTYESQVVEARKFTSAQQLQDKLDELGGKGYQLLAKIDKFDWLILSRPRFTWNGSGDVAAQAAADVAGKVKQADAELGDVLAGTG